MIYMGDPVLSPDGKLMWTGEEWIPAPPKQTQSSDQTIFSGDESLPNTHFNAPESPRSESYNPYSSGEDSAEQSGEALGFATTVAGWNGLVLLALIFTAYSYMEKSQSGPIPSDSWIIIAFKALAVAWVIGIILSVYSRVKSASVQDVETQEQIRILNKTSTVLLALPLLPIALIVLVFYLAMKYGNTGTRHY